MLSSGYTESRANHSLFTKKTTIDFTAILVYVDDLVLAGNDNSEIHTIKGSLDHKFNIKDLGDRKYFLGFEIAHSQSGITIYQRKYSLDLLQDIGLLASKPCNTPMDPNINLSKDSGTPIADPSSYCRLVGRLLYLRHTRPDIWYTVSKLSQYLAAPIDVHQQTAFRVLKYIKSSPGLGLFFPKESNFCLKEFTDLDWGACPDTRRSVSCFSFFLGNALISWKSKKKQIALQEKRPLPTAKYKLLTAT